MIHVHNCRRTTILSTLRGVGADAGIPLIAGVTVLVTSSLVDPAPVCIKSELGLPGGTPTSHSALFEGDGGILIGRVPWLLREGEGWEEQGAQELGRDSDLHFFWPCFVSRWKRFRINDGKFG